MKSITLLGLAVAAVVLSGMTGCGMYVVSGNEDCTDDEVIVVDNTPYVDAYVPISHEVRQLIASSVDGYSMPPISRYSTTLYPEYADNDPSNLPSYVKADFNGDGYYDYAYMFSKITWDHNDWYLKTKMLVVVSDDYGYQVGMELVLGTITGPSSTPIREYWGIRHLRAGTHTYSVTNGATITEEIVTLDNSSIYLASEDPDERSIFTVTGTEVYEMVIDMGSIAKRAIISNDWRAGRIIQVQ